MKLNEHLNLESTWKAGLAAMAADPEIQRELSQINAEFHVTDSDKLAAVDGDTTGEYLSNW